MDTYEKIRDRLIAIRHRMEAASLPTTAVVEVGILLKELEEQQNRAFEAYLTTSAKEFYGS